MNVLDFFCLMFGIRERFGLEPNREAKRIFKLGLFIWFVYSLFLGLQMGFSGYELAKISTNMQAASVSQLRFVAVYEGLSVAGFIFVVGFLGAWIAYQNEIWESHWRKQTNSA